MAKTFTFSFSPYLPGPREERAASLQPVRDDPQLKVRAQQARQGGAPQTGESIGGRWGVHRCETPGGGVIS